MNSNEMLILAADFAFAICRGGPGQARGAMTELLFQTDSYLKDFDAQVIKSVADANAVVLDQTAFYPGGGGQPADVGTLNGQAVTKIRRADGSFCMCWEGALPVEGQSVHGTVDWERRYKLMRTHTAMHVLCGVVFRDDGAQVTGGDMERLKGRMDFEFARLQRAGVNN